MGRGQAWRRVQGGGSAGPSDWGTAKGTADGTGPGATNNAGPGLPSPLIARGSRTALPTACTCLLALRLPDAQASGLTRLGCVAWHPTCASSPPAPVTAALFSTLPLSVFPSWKWSHPHHSLPCPLIFQIRSSRRQSPHLGPNHLHLHPIGGTQRHLHGAPTSSLGTGPRWRLTPCSLLSVAAKASGICPRPFWPPWPPGCDRAL